MSLKTCITSLKHVLKDFDTSFLQEAVDEYVSRGTDEKDAEIRAVQDHMGELERERARIEKAISDAYAVETAAHEAATSPKNDLPQPTEAQKEAGNYQKGHITISGLDIAIENPAGSIRSGTNREGKSWSVKMKDHYGYIRSVRASREGFVQGPVGNPDLLGDGANTQAGSQKRVDQGKVVDVLVARIKTINPKTIERFSHSVFADSKSPRNLGDVNAVPVELRALLSIPALDPSGRINAALNEATANYRAVNAFLFGNTAYAQALRTQSYETLNVDRRSVVQRHMVAAMQDRQIRESIVDLVPIDVVNMLVSPKTTPNSTLDQRAMLLDRLSTAGTLDDSIFVGRLIDGVATSLPAAFARSVTEKEPALRVSEAIGADSEGGVAGGAGDGGSHRSYFSPKGADGDHLDVFVKPGTPTDWSGTVYIVDQKKPGNGHWDEHKAMLGWGSQDSARIAYLRNYSKGWDGIRAVTPMSMNEFKTWLRNDDTTKPASEKVTTAPITETTTAEPVRANRGVAVYEPGAEYGVARENGDPEAYTVEGKRKSYGINPDQFDLFSPAQQKAHQAGRQAASDLGRRAPTVLGSRIARDFEEKGYTDLVGQTIRSADDLATLAQVYRDPRFETMRYLFTDAENRVVYQTGVTSRLPGASFAAPVPVNQNRLDQEDAINAIFAAGKKAGGTKLWLLHNHPSGNSTPSQSDYFLTKRLNLIADLAGLELARHVVINHHEYSEFGASDNSANKVRKEFDRTYDLRDPKIPHRMLGFKIEGPGDVMTLAKQFEANPDSVVIIGRGGSQGAVGLVAEIGTDDLTKLRGAITLRRLAVNAGTAELFAVNVPASLRKQAEWAMRRGLLRDVIMASGESLMERSVGPGTMRGFELGRRMYSYEVRSPEAPYTPEAREPYRWSEITDTANGPMFSNADIILFPAGNQFAGIWGGEGAGYTIVDARTGERLGITFLGLDGNRVSGLYWIESDRSGTGRKVARAVVANSAEPVKIFSIIDSARGFWEKMGVRRYDEDANSEITWEAYTAAARDVGVGQKGTGEALGGSSRSSGRDGATAEEERAGYATEAEGVAENRALREEDRTFRQKAKTWFRRQFAPGGLLPEAVFREKIARDNELQVVEFDIRHLVGRLERAVEAAYGSPFERLNEAQQEALQAGLKGRIDDTLPEDVRTALGSMRLYIDRLSTDYVAILRQQMADLVAEGSDAAAQAKADLIETIVGNVGEYVHRSYRAFDDPKWFQKIPDDTLNTARSYLRQRYLKDNVPADRAARMAEAVLNEIVKNGTAYDSMEAFIKESKLGAKDLSVLKQRQKIAPEIRALLGEYRDPRVNFAKSATKMGRLIWNQTFLDRVREIGIGTFLFEGADRPAAATAPIAADASEVYSPLNGLWTFPEINQAFKDALGRENLGDVYRAIVRLNGLVKYGKTVLSPTTAARNWQSAMFFALANGHFNLTEMRRSLGAMREYFTQQGEGGTLAYLRKLKQLGVVYDTPYAGEMMRLLQDARLDELLSSNSGKALKIFERANRYARDFYSFGDDFWKIVGFENEKQALLMAGLSPQMAEREAAERIRNTYPTYSLVGRAIQSLARNPFIGTFVSFPAEIIRTSINMMRYVARDLRSSNPRLRALGLKRAVGMAMVSAGFAAVSALSRAWLGMDDDDEEAVRELAAPWQKNSTFLFVGRDEDGHLRYFDLSFLDPYGYWKRPITAIMRQQPWEDSAADALKELLTPFLGTDIAAGAMMEIVSNKKGTGGPVYNEDGPAADQVADIANHLRKAIQPGIVSNIERVSKAISGERQASGRVYSEKDEALALAGWRASTIDPRTSLYYRTFEFEDQKQGAMKSLTDVLRDVNEVSDREIESAYETALAAHGDSYAAMRKAVQAARMSGMSDLEMAEVMKLSGIGREDIAVLLGKAPPVLRISQRSMINAVKKVQTLFGPESAKTVMQRYRRAMSMPNRKAG